MNKKMCDRCNGTGNEFYNHYKQCTACYGSGYARNKEEAIQVMTRLIGEDDVKEMIENDGIEVLSVEEFKNGKIHADIDGKLDCINTPTDAPLISYEECLIDCMKDGSTSGHFMTSEY